MNLLDLVHRQPVPEPWAEGEKIPWNDPGFSRRMLTEHLSQEHDLASRRFETIDRHVAWIHDELLRGTPTRVLDLGCGPGLYTSRLCHLGHECVGIDYAPAEIAFARQHAAAEDLRCRYVAEDVRTAGYGKGYGLAMLIYGEFNVFRRSDAHLILEKARDALDVGGILLLEVHTARAVQQLGQQPSSWYSSSSGLFSERPHLCLMECFWDEARKVTTERYFILDALSAEVTRYASSMQAYSTEEYAALLAGCGFGRLARYPSLTGRAEGPSQELTVIVGYRGPTSLAAE